MSVCVACFNKKRVSVWVLSVGLGFAALGTGAQEAPPSEKPPENQEASASSTPPANSGTTYIPLAPPFVVNYGGPGRLKYLKAEMSVRVDDLTSANSVRHHMPLIRNNLVMLFSRQSEEEVNTQEGKERLRKTALKEINDLITAEDGKSGVVEVYFNNLIIQQ